MIKDLSRITETFFESVTIKYATKSSSRDFSVLMPGKVAVSERPREQKNWLANQNEGLRNGNEPTL